MKSAFDVSAASLGSAFYLSYDEKIPIITTTVSGVHEVYGVLTHIESTCTTVVEQIGYDQGLL